MRFSTITDKPFQCVLLLLLLREDTYGLHKHHQGEHEGKEPGTHQSAHPREMAASCEAGCTLHSPNRQQPTAVGKAAKQHTEKRRKVQQTIYKCLFFPEPANQLQGLYRLPHVIRSFLLHPDPRCGHYQTDSSEDSASPHKG